MNANGASKTAKEVTSFGFRPGLLSALRRLSARSKRSMADLMEEAVQDLLKKYPVPPRMAVLVTKDEIYLMQTDDDGSITTKERCPRNGSTSPKALAHMYADKYGEPVSVAGEDFP